MQLKSMWNTDLIILDFDKSKLYCKKNIISFLILLVLFTIIVVSLYYLYRAVNKETFFAIPQFSFTTGGMVQPYGPDVVFNGAIQMTNQLDTSQSTVFLPDVSNVIISDSTTLSAIKNNDIKTYINNLINTAIEPIQSNVSVLQGNVTTLQDNVTTLQLTTKNLTTKLENINSIISNIALPQFVIMPWFPNIPSSSNINFIKQQVDDLTSGTIGNISVLPPGWVICNGVSLSQNQDFVIPNLCGKFILGASESNTGVQSSDTSGNKGGNTLSPLQTATSSSPSSPSPYTNVYASPLTVSQIPAHSHIMPIDYVYRTTNSCAPTLDLTISGNASQCWRAQTAPGASLIYPNRIDYNYGTSATSATPVAGTELGFNAQTSSFAFRNMATSASIYGLTDAIASQYNQYTSKNKSPSQIAIPSQQNQQNQQTPQPIDITPPFYKMIYIMNVNPPPSLQS